MDNSSHHSDKGFVATLATETTTLVQPNSLNRFLLIQVPPHFFHMEPENGSGFRSRCFFFPGDLIQVKDVFLFSGGVSRKP